MDYSELIDHPEGGRFKEVFRSGIRVSADTRQRSALTHIYFSLNKDEVSRFHRVTSDEIWNLYEGKGLKLYLWDESTHTMEEKLLSREKREYCLVVRAGLWQAAEPLGAGILVGCSVAPGFEFSDFELIRADSAVANDILSTRSDLTHLIG